MVLKLSCACVHPMPVYTHFPQMSNVLSVSTMFVTLLRTYKLNFEASTKALSRIVIRLPREANGMCDQVCTGVAHLRRCRCRGEQALAGARSLPGLAEDNLRGGCGGRTAIVSLGNLQRCGIAGTKLTSWACDNLLTPLLLHATVDASVECDAFWSADSGLPPGLLRYINGSTGPLKSSSRLCQG